MKTTHRMFIYNWCCLLLHLIYNHIDLFFQQVHNSSVYLYLSLFSFVGCVFICVYVQWWKSHKAGLKFLIVCPHTRPINRNLILILMHNQHQILSVPNKSYHLTTTDYIVLFHSLLLSLNVFLSFCRITLEIMTLQPRCEDVETAEGVAITVTGVAQVRPHAGVTHMDQSDWISMFILTEMFLYRRQFKQLSCA